MPYSVEVSSGVEMSRWKSFDKSLGRNLSIEFRGSLGGDAARGFILHAR
jgi:hypothetical protein